MFDFVDEFDQLKNIVVGFRYVCYDNKLVVVQGYKDILLLDTNNVVLKLKKGELDIKGDNLNLAECFTNFLVVKGKINIIEMVD